AFDISANGILQSVPRDEALVLFDLICEEIENPEFIKGFSNTLVTSDQRDVKAQELQSALGEAEEEIEKSFFGLKGRKKTRTAPQVVVNVRPGKGDMATMASLSSRFTAGVIDMGICIGLSLLVLALTSSEDWEIFNKWLFSHQGVKAAEIIGFAARTAALFIGFFNLYPIIARRYYRRTIGHSLVNLEIICDNGHPLSNSNMIIYSLVAPVSLALFGYLPIFKHKRSFHEVVAQVVVTKGF
ncbi:MAG: RDD family protein, partial [Bdellovibrionales bacterium]|nr:RDD family protein [Bdellovibrionales bacterium]